MPDPKVTIRIGSTADTRGIKQSQAELDRLKSSAKQAADALRTGFGVDIAGRIVSSFASIPTALAGALRQGLEFNAVMANAETGIANIVARFQGLNGEAAKSAAGKALAQIAELEPKVAGTMQDLLAGFSATLASSAAAGLSIEQNIDLLGRFANALSNTGQPAHQLAQEMRAILSGNINQDAALAKILEISNEDINKAKSAGTLYQFLVEKIGALGAASDSVAAKVSSFQSQVSKLSGELAKPMFDVLVSAMEDLAREMRGGSFKRCQGDR